MRPRVDIPMVTNRGSTLDWSVSGNVFLQELLKRRRVAQLECSSRKAAAAT